MRKAFQPSQEQKWVGVDLHVHTPASEDYQGPRERSEYIKILKRANEFEEATIAVGKVRSRRRARPIGCIAFTDHNSVEGFREWRRLYDETVSLAEAVRDRDPGNTLLQQLDKDLGVLRSVRVLMGVELNAYPGVHLLVIFHESIRSEAVEAFLEDAYGRKYNEIAGKPGPVTAVQIEELLGRVSSTFGEQAMVIAPHAESGGGLLEVLKDLHQILMPVVRHKALEAMSFNKAETREKVKELLTQPHYARVKRLALIQSSDAHGSGAPSASPELR